MRLPEGVAAGEATLVLEVFARVKRRRFGRVALSVSEGRLVDVEVIEKVASGAMMPACRAAHEGRGVTGQRI